MGHISAQKLGLKPCACNQAQWLCGATKVQWVYVSAVQATPHPENLFVRFDFVLFGLSVFVQKIDLNHILYKCYSGKNVSQTQLLQSLT